MRTVAVTLHNEGETERDNVQTQRMVDMGVTRGKGDITAQLDVYTINI